MIKRKLYVIIPCRDRLILTKKCIDSIRFNTKLFNEIIIYVFDNNSNLNIDRLSVFQKLLKENKIQYYSYDTDSTMFNCFGKSVVFQRWIDMMKIQKEFRDSKKLDEGVEQYYMLVDNDFIFGPEWDSYFITSAKYINDYNKQTHFIVKYPSGIPSRKIDFSESKTLENFFNNRKYKLHFSSNGGSSGMWFMTYDMLLNLKWNYNHFNMTYNVNKRHDTGTWTIIKKEKGRIKYVTALDPPDDERLILHLGKITGSLCNKLQLKQYNESERERIENNEKILENMTVFEIFNKYKDECYCW